MLKRQNPVDQIRWLEAVNQNGAALPAFGLARVVSVDANGVLTVDQPNTDGQDVVVNGPFVIPASGRGLVTRDGPIHALYHAADGVPAGGDQWGAGNGGWDLRKGKPGFVIAGGVTAGRVLVYRPSGLTSGYLIVTSGAVTAATGSLPTITPGTGTGKVYYYDGTHLVQHGTDTLAVLNALSVAIPDATFCQAILEPYSSKWIITGISGGYTGTTTVVDAVSCSAGVLSVTSQTYTWGDGDLLTVV